MGVKERLQAFLDYSNIQQARFERKVGLSNGFVNNIGKSIRGDSLFKISNAYPELSKSWLMLGEGKMFSSDNETLMYDLKNLSITASIAEYKKEIQQLKEKIQNLEEKIEMKNEIINLLKANKINEKKDGL
jgi:hypothetical protein